jgi:flagellar assembly protein FliH
LKNYAAFFEQATFQMETKLLKTSISIAQKIISIEVGENSSKIAKQTITHLLDKIKTASKIQIHLNSKDYEILKGQLNLEPFIELKSDANVTAGGVVIASDLGNFDGNIDSKVSSMLDSLDLII